jgi:hypothetical protein
MSESGILKNPAKVSSIEFLVENVLFPAPHAAPILDELSAGDNSHVLAETPTRQAGG